MLKIAQTKTAPQAGGSRSWLKTTASLAPVWLLAFAATSEGFPSPPWPAWLTVPSFLAAIFIALALVLFRLVRIEVILVSLLPLAYLLIFDEITNAYKPLFIFFCTLILSIGMIAFQHTNSRYVPLFLPVAVLLSLFAAYCAADNFWAYTSSLGIRECFLDYTGCPPLPIDSPAWWQFFIP